MDDISEYFDEDGNLISTSWKKEEEEKQRKKQQEEEEKRRGKLRKEIKRRAAMDNSRDKFLEEHERKQRERSIKEEWMELPQWIKKMPRTSLSEPPTEGSFNMMKYKMTGKVQLTEEEEKRRKKQLKKVKLAMDMHRKIAREVMFSGVAYVPVVGFGSDDSHIGSTAVTRCIMKSLSDSRPGIDALLAVDFGDSKNNFSDWFTNGSMQYVFLNHFIGWIKSGNESYDTGMFSVVDGRQMFLSNHKGGKQRVNVSIDTIATAYSFLNKNIRRGFIIADHDINEAEGSLAGITLATTPVFVVPIERNAAQKISTMLSILESSVSSERFDTIKKRVVLVTNSASSDLAEPKARDIVSKFLDSVARECGLNTSRTVNIPYDTGLTRKPLQWQKVSFPTQHMIRTICSFIIDDLIEDYGE